MAIGLSRRGASLVEVVVVLGIVSAGLGLALVGVQESREAASRITCQQNLKSLLLSIHTYHDMHRHMPPYASGRPGEIYGGWFMHLLPFIGHANLHKEIETGQSSISGGVQIFTMGMTLPGVEKAAFAELACPSDPTRTAASVNKTNYLANWYGFSDGGLGAYRPAQRFAALADGLANVLLLAEGYTVCEGLERLALFSANFHNFGITQDNLASDDPFYAPKDYTMFQVRPADCDKWRAQTPHAAMHVAFGDGAVRAVSQSISADSWKHALKPRDGQPPGNDW